jgi:hypothetical protein
MVNLTTFQVETLFDALEGINLKLEALGIVEDCGGMTYEEARDI